MKKIILSLVVAAFAVAVQAGDDAACATKAAAGGCCASKQATTQVNSQKSCPMADKEGVCKMKSSKIAKKQLKSPKAKAEARQ